MLGTHHIVLPLLTSLVCYVLSAILYMRLLAALKSPRHVHVKHLAVPDKWEGQQLHPTIICFDVRYYTRGTDLVRV